MTDSATKTPPDMKLRISMELRQRIEAAAKANGRTMTGEIVVRLEESFEIEPGVRELLISHQKSIDELIIESGDYAKRILALQTIFEELSDEFRKIRMKS